MAAATVQPNFVCLPTFAAVAKGRSCEPVVRKHVVVLPKQCSQMEIVGLCSRMGNVANAAQSCSLLSYAAGNYFAIRKRVDAKWNARIATRCNIIEMDPQRGIRAGKLGLYRPALGKRELSNTFDIDKSGTGHSSGRRWRRVQAVQADSKAGDNPLVEKAEKILHVAISLGVFLALDKFLKDQFVAVGIRFPSALFGMFCIFALLNVADAVKPEVAALFISFFQPAITFIQRWLPLFYVPSLVVVPLAIKGIPAAAAAKIALILVGGWVASLAVAGCTAVTVRNLVKTELQVAEFTPKPAPFAAWELKSLGVATILSFALAVYAPTALGTVALTASPFFLSATALGYVFGSGLPADMKKIFHPIITCAITADIAAFAYGSLTKIGFEGALKTYLTKQAGNPGAGDFFMGVLGSVILSFAFSMFYQRKLVKRHAPEIFSAVMVTGVFSLYSTALVGRFLGLPSSLTLAVVPRCITVALALPIAGLLEGGNPSLTAAVVVLTGLVGANFTQVVMDKFGFNDPISRGMATASSAHGLGTAALSAKEPEALPFCAIAYALTGIFCSVLVSVPVVQQSLVMLASSA